MTEHHAPCRRPHPRRRPVDGAGHRHAAPVPARSLAARLFRPLVEARTWKATCRPLLNLPFGIAWFTIIVTGLSVGVGRCHTDRHPVLLLMLLFSRVISAVERARAGLLLDIDGRVALPVPLAPGGLWEQIKALIADGAAWKALASACSLFPLGIVTFVTAVVLWSVGLTGSVPAVRLGAAPGTSGLDLGVIERALGQFVTGVAGLIVLIVTPQVVRGMAAVDRALVRALLGPSGTVQLQQRVEELAVSRDASVDAAEAERRRIERDLHDGAQQRLVALAMDLGLAASGWSRRRSRRATPSSSTRPTTRQAGDHRAARARPRHPPGGARPTAGSTPRSRRSPPAARSRSTLRSTSANARRRPWRRRPTSWSPRR